MVFGIEVLDMQEETNTTTSLVPENRSLIGAVGECQEEARLSARWPHHNPPFWPSIVGLIGAIRDQVEAKDVDEEVDGSVVIVDDEGDKVEVHRHEMRGYPSLPVVPGTTGLTLMGAQPGNPGVVDPANPAVTLTECVSPGGVTRNEG